MTNIVPALPTNLPKALDGSKRWGICNSQVKDNKIDLLVQQYEQFTILEEESIDSSFARFNTIITSLKALDEGFFRKNYLRKCLRALHPKWRAKVTAIEESKDLSSLALDELIVNLKVHEVVMEKDFKIYRGKKERVKSIALKSKKESSDDETSTSGSDDEEYAMAVKNFKKFFRRKGKFVRQPREEKKSFRQRDEKKGKSAQKCFRCGDPNHLICDCPKPSRNKDQKAFIGGSWNDSENDAEDKTNNETCLMAQSSNEVTLNSFCYSDNASSLDNDNMQIEYDSLCEISLKIINNNKILKTKRDLLDKEILELYKKIKKLERSKEIEIACKSCDELKLENAKLKETQVALFDSDKASTSGTKTMSFVGSSAEKGTDGSTIMAHGSTLPGSVCLRTCLELDEWIKDSGCSKHMTDHGREFDNEVQFGAYCDAQGITHNFSAPRTPQSNGVVERKNRTLQEMSRTMLNEQYIPEKIWCNVVDTSTYILNRILIRPILGKTPYEIFRGRKPSLEYFKVFGSKCFILNTKDYLTKFDPKSYEGVFLGYSQNSKANIILNKHTIKVEESLNVTFDESPHPTKLSPMVDDDVGEEEAIINNTKVVNNNNEEDELIEVDEVVNIKESKNHPLDQVIGNINQINLRSQAQDHSNFFCFISIIEPKNVNEALKDESWVVAMQEELNQFVANDVWDLVPLPMSQSVIGTKWVFRNKLDENGIVSRNKARLVAQGYNQQEGIDYDETYAPVARLESIRILLAIACANDFKLYQMDVKSAFLNGFINEEVYVAQPPGFIDFQKPNYVYKLKKALYGLKQAPKAWYDRLKAFLIKHEYSMGMVDNTLFTKKSKSHLIIVQIYVDDIIFGSTSQNLCDDFAKIMHDEFEMSMMGELNFFLGLQIKQMEDGIFFNQSKYIKEMLKKFGLEDSKPTKTPMSTEIKLTKDDEADSVDSSKYRGMIGSLLYLTASRPDIMFSVCLCARFQENPKTTHLEAVKRIFRSLECHRHGTAVVQYYLDECGMIDATYSDGIINRGLDMIVIHSQGDIEGVVGEIGDLNVMMTLSGVGSIRRIRGIRYGVSRYLGVGTTIDIFQNLLHTISWIRRMDIFWIRRIGLQSFVVFGECRHRYAVSSLLDTAYWSSK
ncbi:retrovirus-related pol polyprotein from transposon TNT 1-94 [Tanacetum coccineum]